MGLMHMHAIGATEEITLVELDIDPQEENQEVQHLEVPREESLRLIISWSALIISQQRS